MKKKVIRNIYDEQGYKDALKREIEIFESKNSYYCYRLVELTDADREEILKRVNKEDFLKEKKEYLLHKIALNKDNDIVFIVSDFDGRNFQHFKAENCVVVEMKDEN